jgi:histidinol-phosphate aminotransferase
MTPAPGEAASASPQTTSDSPAPATASPEPPGTRIPNAERAGAQVAGAQVAGAQVAGAQVAGAQVAGAQVAGAEVAGAEVAGAEVAGGAAAAGRGGGDEVDLWHHGDKDLDPDAPGQLDLAVNVRLPRPPEWLRARLDAALGGLGAYPRPDAAVAAVARRHGRGVDEVLLTNGAAEAFTLIARALRPRHAVCVHPSFTAPEAALRDAGHEVRRVLLDPPFTLAADDIPDDADLVVLGNPTNPTGRLHPVSVLERLARPGRVLVIDEAFADAIGGEPASLSARRDLGGVLVIRSLTKAWGLAGLRVGYVLGEPSLLAALRQAQPPWPVNSLALTALESCSQPEAVAWVERQAATAASWRQALAAALDELPGVEVPAGGQAPFLLVRVADATAVRQRLRGLGIAVRRGDTFPGLGDQWLRIAVVAPEHHSRIVDAFARSTGSAARRTRRADRPDSLAPPSTRVTQAGEAGPPARTAVGAVTLIGAGPGGADLITVRGWRALQAADVVVADRLADPRLTGELRPGVVLINAGKSPGAHQLSQDATNEVLIEHAAAGRQVARLKGGDPFVFGRGGEEAAACAAAGIPCSVVPGLSSATAGPALAGIPLTHREVSQSFSVVSGHLPPDHPASRVDWAALAAGTDTLVLLMAVRNLPAIAAHLLDLGRPAVTPAACVESAGTPDQRVRHTTLAGLARPAPGEPPVRNPAIIVIGSTASALGTSHS